MRLRKECEHGRWEEHTFLRPGGNPESSIAYWDCPGGEFLPEGALVIEKENGRWPESARDALKDVLWSSKGYTFNTLLDALASQVGESE